MLTRCFSPLCVTKKIMELYNTLTRKKEEFKPLKQDVTKVYYCGPTVYNFAHIGNLKNYCGNDIIVKSLKFLGYPVKTVMNITDVEDKIIRTAIERGEWIKEFTEFYTEEFFKDTAKLWITQADVIEPISNIIPEMVRMINTMLKRGFAYEAEGSVYFKISEFKKYGKLANLDFKWMKESVRIDNDEYDKESASDFALWKWYDSEKDGEVFWEEEFELPDGKQKLKGRPGWHIECSGCAMKHFWPQIDIHMWGIDLVFPHHQNEIAQTESCTRKPFSKYWLHGGHLMVDGKKMSKSLWNFYTLRDIEEKFVWKVSESVLFRSMRLSFINGKYRDSVEFNFDKLESLFATIFKSDETLKSLGRYKQRAEEKWISKEFREQMQWVMQDFIACLEDDFNIPEAMALFFSFQKFVNSWIAESAFSLEESESIIDMYEQLDSVLWIMDFGVLEELWEEELPEEISALFKARQQAKSEKDFASADSYRDQLMEKGYKIVDEREGSRVESL